MAIDLKSIQKGKKFQPIRMIIYGTDGVGKSTMAAGAPNPIFLDVEDGLGQLDVDRWKIESFDDLNEAIGVLYEGGHDYKSIVLDSIDWLERLVWTKVILEHNKANPDKQVDVITDIGYGKGYALAIDYWQQIKDGLEALRLEKGINIILIAHHKITKVTPPDMLESYDRYTLDLNDKAAALFREWVDLCMFMNFKVHTQVVKKDDFTKTKVSKAVGHNTVMGYFYDRPAAYAKSRYDLPEEIELPKEGAFSMMLDAIKESFNTNIKSTTKGEK